ncbi:hypothetical protein Tco_1314335 [Tanacetum coccineum]
MSQVPSSDPNIASSSRPHDSASDLFTSTNVEDETMRGSFHTSPPSSYILSDEFAGGFDVPAGATTDPSNKGKSPLLEEDPPVRERTFRQREEDRLGEEAARRMYEEEQDELEREREEMQRKRQQDVLNSAKYYTDSDWTDIMGQVSCQSRTYTELIFLGLMSMKINSARKEWVALFAKEKKRFCCTKNQSSTIYTTGWTMKHVKSFSDDQLKTEFDKIRTAVAELKSLNIRRSLKRPVPPNATQQPSEFSSQPTIPSAEPSTHSYVLSYDSDDSDADDDPPIFWPAFAAWEVVPTGPGVVNTLYFMDKSSKYFTHLREILHWFDRKISLSSIEWVVPTMKSIL